MTDRERQCCRCGAAIAGPPYLAAGNDLCCEHCYLQRYPLEAAPASLISEIEAFAEALAAALDLREHETGAHSKRVACHTLVLAKRFSDVPVLLRQIYWGALLHDIGKIGVPDSILRKPGALTEAEDAVMREHPQNGFNVLRAVPHMEGAAEIVLSHQERYDGHGYPRGLAGDAIPLGARLFAVIDALDAITSRRPYRPAQPYEAAKTEIERCTGTQFDPRAVEAFLAEETVLREMVAVKCGTPPAHILETPRQGAAGCSPSTGVVA